MTRTANDEVENDPVEQVVAWLRANLPPVWVAAAEAGDREALEGARAHGDHAALRRLVGAAGWATPAWPREYGGLGLSADAAGAAFGVLDRYVVFPAEDFVGRTLAGPTILQWGTAEQRERFLRRSVEASNWCQLFSEPGSGSDLAGLSTRAVRDGEVWIVDGQKVWTSAADTADYGLLMARTDPDAPKHKGITYFVVDMHTAGVDVRPLREMTGLAHFNEVFLTGVVVPDAQRLGAVNEGWRVSVTTLTTERSALSGGPGVGRGRVDLLLARARRSGASADPRTRQRLMRMDVDERLLAVTNGRAAAARSHGRPAGSEGSITKLVRSELIQRIAHAVVDVSGPAGVAWEDDDTETSAIVQTLLYSPAHTIAGGTSEIQRNVIGERVLGLPREPDVDRDLPWTDIARDGSR